jgi:hypothetical protein
MKKNIFLLFLAVMVAAGSFGQGFCIGPKIGYSASKLSTNIPDIKESMNNNFMIGAFMRVGEKVYFQPEVLYTTRGGVFEDTLNMKEDIKFKNLEIPLMVGFHLLNLKVFNFRFMGGPVASFILDKDISFDENMADPITEAELKDIIWGLDVGLGIDVLFMTLDVRWEFGLNNLYEAASGGQSYDMKNNLFIVGLGFKFL